MNVGIVGLGLIGGSMAKSIKLRTAHIVWGIDLDAETMTLARLSGAIDAPLTGENLGLCNLLLIAIRPNAALDWVRSHADEIDKKTLLWSISAASSERSVPPSRPSPKKRAFPTLAGTDGWP